MKTLVLVEHERRCQGRPLAASPPRRARRGASARCGGRVGPVADAAARSPAGKVLCRDDALRPGLAENVAPLAAHLWRAMTRLVAPAPTTGKNIAPRVACFST